MSGTHTHTQKAETNFDICNYVARFFKSHNLLYIMRT